MDLTDEKLVIITAIQERLDNSVLTVRVDGEVIGTVVLNGRNQWLARQKPPPEPVTHETLQAAVEWLYEHRK